MNRTTDMAFSKALEDDYRAALRAYLEGAGETALTQAYELGRRAVNAHVTLLEIAAIHERAAAALGQAASEQDCLSPGSFLTEVLSPYEMTLRAYQENAKLLGLSEAPARQNAELGRAHRHLSTILDATTAVIYLRDTAERFVFVNRRFEAVFGVRHEAIVNSTGHAQLGEAISDILRDGDRRALVGGLPLELEETLPLAGGDRTYLSLKVPLLDPSAMPYAVCCVATDISERKRAAEALRRAHDETEAANRALKDTQAQLVQSAKMASLGELVAGIAHELNNPLAFALSHTDTVRTLVARTELAVAESATSVREDLQRATHRLDETQKGLERIRELVLKLRVFSRLDEGERKPANIRECVESVLMILGHRLRDRIDVETVYGAPEELDCYPGLLNQALLNLVTNALDAMPNGGRLRIETGMHEGLYRIRISDSGLGIPAAFRERIFEPFFTTKPVGVGTGLGLSITYSIVQKHAGTLLVDCPDAGGTVMTVVLPLDRPSAIEV